MPHQTRAAAAGWPHLIVQALAMTTTTTRPSQTLFRSLPAAAAAFSSTQYNPISTALPLPCSLSQWHLPVSNIIIIGNGNGIEHSHLCLSMPCRVLRLCTVCLWLCLKCQVTMPDDDDGNDDATAIAVYWYWCNFVVVVVAGVACGWLAGCCCCRLFACLLGWFVARCSIADVNVVVVVVGVIVIIGISCATLAWNWTETKPWAAGVVGIQCWSFLFPYMQSIEVRVGRQKQKHTINNNNKLCSLFIIYTFLLLLLLVVLVLLLLIFPIPRFKCVCR